MIGFEILEALQTVPSLKSLTSSLLAEGGYAPLNPLVQIEKLRPQVVLLNDAAGDGGLDPQVLIHCKVMPCCARIRTAGSN